MKREYDDLNRLLKAIFHKPMHTSYQGSSGTGKSTLQLWAALDRARQLDCAVAFFAPIRMVGLLFVMLLREFMLLDRLVVHDLGNMDTTLPKRFLHVSSNPNPAKRRQENEDARDAFLAVLIRRRKDFEDLAERPAIEQNAKDIVGVYQNLDAWMPLNHMPRLLVKGSVVQLWAIDHCADPEYRWKLQRIAQLNDHKQFAEVMPTERFLTGGLDSAQMRAMCSHPPSFSVPAHLRDCGTGEPGIYLCIGGGSDEATSFVMATDVQQIVFDAKANKPPHTTYVFRDELLNFNLYRGFEARAHATMRNFDLFFHDALQSPDFGDPVIDREFTQNGQPIIFAQRDPDLAKKSARQLTGLYDRMRVHHTDEATKQRVVHGSQHRTSEGSWEGPNGTQGKSKNTTVVPTTEHQDYVEKRDVYERGDDQEFWLAKEIGQLPDLTCIAQPRGSAPERYVLPFIPDLCAFPEDFEMEVSECLAEIYSQPVYKIPQELTIVEPEPQQPPPKPKKMPRRAPQGKPRSAGRTYAPR